MRNDIIELYKNFILVKRMGYVKSLRSGFTGIGYTFETLINKKEDNLPIADFNNIEIKTIHRFSKRKLHLFSASPDGDFLYPINRLVNEMGYPDKEFKDKKILNITINANEYTNIGYYKKMKLAIDYDNKIIKLIGIKNNKQIELNISWSFDFLEKRLEQKIKYLAIVEASSKKNNDDEYFYYNKILFFKIKSFKDFIDLVDKGYISITFKIGLYREGVRMGQIHDRGTDFSIYYENIDLLYDRINMNNL